MTLLQLIEKIDISKNSDPYINFNFLCEEFNLHYVDIFDIQQEKNEFIRSQIIMPYYDTDEVVGTKAYFFKGKLFAISDKPGRKIREKLLGITDIEVAKEVKNYILSLVSTPKVDWDSFDIIDPDKEELGEGYSIQFVSSLMSKTLIYKGEIVEVIKTPRYIDNDLNFHTCTILYKNEEIDIDIREALVPYLS